MWGNPAAHRLALVAARRPTLVAVRRPFLVAVCRPAPSPPAGPPGSPPEEILDCIVVALPRSWDDEIPDSDDWMEEYSD